MSQLEYRKIKREIAVIMLALTLLISAGCEYSLEVISVELGKFPNNIVYYAGESSKLDLRGGTVIIKTRSGDTHEEPLAHTDWGSTDAIDFDTPGVYEVNIISVGNKFIGRFPIQVIERK